MLLESQISFYMYVLPCIRDSPQRVNWCMHVHFNFHAISQEPLSAGFRFIFVRKKESMRRFETSKWKMLNKGYWARGRVLKL